MARWLALQVILCSGCAMLGFRCWGLMTLNLDGWRLALQVILCSACSGHGFKMSSAIGEVLATMATSGSRPPASSLGGAMALHEIRTSRPEFGALMQSFEAGG
jgi:hypothetical protein